MCPEWLGGVTGEGVKKTKLYKRHGMLLIVIVIPHFHIDTPSTLLPHTNRTSDELHLAGVHEHKDAELVDEAELIVERRLELLCRMEEAASCEERFRWTGAPQNP